MEGYDLKERLVLRDCDDGGICILDYCTDGLVVVCHDTKGERAVVAISFASMREMYVWLGEALAMESAQSEADAAAKRAMQ